jgi:sigma-B regulation protein RsbU (phosphoserine phosphatase)
MVSTRPLVVLLVDDQQIVGEAVRRMLASEPDVVFHFCPDPTQALIKAREVGPTVILQDLVMPEMDGLTLVKFFRANRDTREVPLIVLSSKEEPVVKAQAFGLGANDYLVKLPDKIELIARIRYHSQAYIHLLERNEAYRQLEASQKQLAAEVNRAALYVQSLLPAPLTSSPTAEGQGSVTTNWRFIPSTTLGGDVFGYHWIDPNHLAIFLLDVCGHGVGAALLAVSAMNVLSSQTLPATDFRDPGQVMRGLNETFQMEKHNNQYFTIWYGVYDRPGRSLRYAGGGHPAGLLFTGSSRDTATLQRLECEGPPAGVISEYEFVTDTCKLEPYALLYLYSDGAFEIARPDASMWTHDEFIAYMTSLEPKEANPMDCLLEHVRQMHQGPTLADDFSILQVRFG